MRQAHVFISGAVQGVGYRFFVRSWARTFVISGWVANLSDGRVEAVFQGEKSAIQKMIDQCRKGPFLAEVKKIQVQFEEAAEEFGDFKIA